MRRGRRLILIAFIESFACLCVQRGVFFFAQDRLGFSSADNLWLALAFGVAYVIGALASHPLARAVKEKPLLISLLCGQTLVHAVMGVWPVTGVVFVGSTVLGSLHGMKWPLVETYISAGLGPKQTARAIGRFNISWASAGPLALLGAGPIIRFCPPGLFVLPAVLNGVSLWLARPLARSPVYLPADHPERPAEGQMARLAALLSASRWLLLASYAAMWILAALMPNIFDDLGFGIVAATALAGLIDLVRLGAFVGLERYAGWHGRMAMLVVGMIGLPIGFFAVAFGRVTGLVVAGEVVFALAAGMVYYAALYYAMVVKNAAVDAGGTHEGLIGLGFAIGPAAGLLGVALVPVLGHDILGILVGVGPVFLACTAGAVKALRRAGPSEGPSPGAGARHDAS